MKYKHFRIRLIIRLALILLLGYMTIFVWTKTYFWLVAIWMGLAVILLTIELIRFVERSYRELNNFLISVSQHDFSNTYLDPSPKSTAVSLRPALANINQVFRSLRSEKESGFLYLQTVVEHISVALVCFDENETVQLTNQAAKDLFRKPYFHQIHGLKSIDPHLYQVVLHLKNGERELVELEGRATLAVRATEFILLDTSYKLVSFQNIKDELEEKEVESWQKLIRVLTHEIMNSVIPISTLSSVIREMLENTDFQSLRDEDIEDLRHGLGTIEKRSAGLVNFVKAYKSLTKAYDLHVETIAVETLFGQVVTLLKAQLEAEQVQVVLETPQGLEVTADPEFIEQCLLNLMINALDAVKGRPTPQITLSAAQNALGRVVIRIQDNGKGISPEVMENVFVPFYTTKPNGSGVGLSLTRQVMQLHKGNVQLHSKEEVGTTVLLTF